MRRIVTLAVAFVLPLAFSNMVSAKELTGAEITKILSGNSIKADDEVQYFDPDGSTIYKTGGKRKTGKWSVKGNKYCSNLSGDNKCYPIEGGKGSVSFIVNGMPYEYKVLKGQKVK